ncbi:MAG: helical backbone metal receptor [Candidatus Cloacimonetes bacterium]|nr:helical backbone metal receptor [Candidatus Cloacimonadota bacterium]
MKNAATILLILVLISCNQTTNSPKGIIITSPEIAELAAHIAPEAIIAVTDECNYPALLNSLPKVGKFGEINLEKIVKLNPEAVITTGMEQEIITEKLKKLGIKTIPMYITSMNSMPDKINELALILNKPEKGKILSDSLRNLIKNLEKNIQSQKPTIYIEIYNEPIMTVSNGSLVGDVVRMSGVENIFPELPREYCRINQEEVVEANPDIILITYEGISAENIANRKGWQNINAVRNRRIYTPADINPDLILRATLRTFEGIEVMKKLFNQSEKQESNKKQQDPKILNLSLS